MFKRIARLAATLSAVAILGTTLAGAAFAQGPAQPASPAAPGANFGAGRGAFGPAWGGQSTLATVSKLTGLETDEIRSQRQNGKSLSQIAEANGVAKVKLVESILAAKKDVVTGLVAEKKLTQDQADAMLAQMSEQVASSVDRTTTGPANGRGNGACLSTGAVNPDQALRQGPGGRGGFGGGMAGRLQAPAATR